MNIVACGRSISRVGAEAGLLKRNLFLLLLGQTSPIPCCSPFAFPTPCLLYTGCPQASQVFLEDVARTN